jgi:hypothetical protein
MTQPAKTSVPCGENMDAAIDVAGRFRHKLIRRG